MKKPTGNIGPIGTSIDSKGNLVASVANVPFPQDKEEIEKYIVERFIYSANKELEKSGEQFIIFKPSKNHLDDFDFNVQTQRGKAYLELMEAAPLEKTKGGYSKAPASYKPYEYAIEIFEKITEKSKKYPKGLKGELFLLLYVTHWTFVFSETTMAYLRYFCSMNAPKFNAIFSYVPFDVEVGTVRWIYPVPPELLKGFDPDKYKNNEVLNLDPEKFEVRSDIHVSGF
jgi:hypothetical protein